ncbi:MAG: hypothetical protein QNL33_06555 [Akkermansiaceae bacterium]
MATASPAGKFSVPSNPTSSARNSRSSRLPPSSKKIPEHPAHQLGLASKSSLEAYRAITAPNFLKTLSPPQRNQLVSYRDTLIANLRATGHPDFPAPAGYTRFDRRGWPVFIHKDLIGKCDRALELLDYQLQDIVDRVPALAVAYLKKVPLYFTPSPDGSSRACHHPGSHWLRTHGKPVEMAKSIEFTNVENFEFETQRMPNFALHELAHAYHNHLLGDGHQAIRDAFQKAKESGTSQNIPLRTPKPNRPPVANIKGETYAMSNQMEYFAEATEAYFSESDFYPFDRPDLIKHDPEIVAILEDVWGIKKSRNSVLAANRIVFLGDSITAAGQFVIDLQAALHLQGHVPEIISIGLGSEGVTGLSEPAHPFPRPNLHERLDRVLEKTKPDLIIASYGINEHLQKTRTTNPEKLVNHYRARQSLLSPA